MNDLLHALPSDGLTPPQIHPTSLESFLRTQLPLCLQFANESLAHLHMANLILHQVPRSRPELIPEPGVALIRRVTRANNTSAWKADTFSAYGPHPPILAQWRKQGSKLTD